MITITVISISTISLAQSSVNILIQIERNDVACIVISPISLGQWTVGHSGLLTCALQEMSLVSVLEPEKMIPGHQK